jgi:hypothetical protein
VPPARLVVTPSRKGQPRHNGVDANKSRSRPAVGRASLDRARTLSTISMRRRKSMAAARMETVSRGIRDRARVTVVQAHVKSPTTSAHAPTPLQPKTLARDIPIDVVCASMVKPLCRSHRLHPRERQRTLDAAAQCFSAGGGWSISVKLTSKQRGAPVIPMGCARDSDATLRRRCLPVRYPPGCYIYGLSVR